MIRNSFFVRLEAKPGKEADVVAFLESGLSLAQEEARTPIWFALRFSESTFGIFDAFESEDNREAHLRGPIGQALMAKADELFVGALKIEPVDVLGVKNQPS
jgi:quinol monooxygenase YgiN